MPSVWEQRFAGALKRLAGLRESTQLELLPDLMPSLPLLDPASVELLAARGEHAALSRSVHVSGAGDAPVFTLFNPAASGLVVVVDELILATTLAARWELTFDTVASVAAGTEDFDKMLADQRLVGGGAVTSPRPVAQTWRESISGYTGTHFFAFPAINTAYRLPVGVVLPPGKGVRVGSVTNAVQTAWAGWRWRERATRDEATFR